MHDLLSELSSLNVRLEAREGMLHVSAPSGALTPSLRERIQQHRNALVTLLSTAPPDVQDAAASVLEPNAKDLHEPFPLNEVQHAYWVGRQAHIELGNVASHIYFELDCDGLDLARLNAAFNRVVANHDMLRAVVDADGRQRVLPRVDEYTIAATDLRHLDGDARENALLAIRGQLSERQIPCDRWPLFDLRAARIDHGRTRLFLSWDFIFLDAWSLLLVFRQWNQCYRDAHVGLDKPRLSFRDYVLAEAGRKELPSYRNSQKYWWDRVDSLPAAPMLPLAAKPGRMQPHRFTRRQFELDAATWQALKKRARQAGLTPSSLLLGAFSEVLNRWSKQAHYCLSLTLFNRRDLHPDVGLLVGDFTNLLLLEIDGRSGRNFLERTRDIQDRFLRDFEHRDVSAVEVLRELARRRGESLKAIAPVVFTSTLMLEGADGEGGGLEQFGRLGWGISQTPQVWLDYQIFERDGRLLANWDGVDELFLPGVLDAMFEANRDLLHSLANVPRTWDEDPVLALPAPQQQRREALDDTAAELPDGCLHDGFVRYALAHPDRIAVRSAGRELRYGECLEQAYALSLELLQLGVRPNQLVAVVMDKGWEQIVAVMAILLSGAAYLPIDTRWPQRRREEVLTRAEVRVALTQTDVDARLQWPDSVKRVVVADAQAPGLEASPPTRQQPTDLAYVIFTSGSTGVPKGVMVDHRAALNTVSHINRLFDVSERDCVLGLSDLGFDLSVYDIFGTLAAGGTLVVPDAKAGRDPAHWCELVRKHEITVWNSAPQLMNISVEHAQASDGALPSLRLVMLSGDWIPTRLPDRVRALAPGADVISLGGATEGSIWSIYFPIDVVDPHWDSIPYGKALPNQHMYVLDARMQSCPDHVTGQVCIGGSGVALGYWKDSDRTSQQFVQHPATGERLYLTGDLGRYLPDGNIEFLGREDAQVKLRGYRVELGEITANLQSHPGVHEAAVRVVKRDGHGSLLAYVVPASPRAEPLFRTDAVPEARLRACEAAVTRAAAVQSQQADLPALKDFAHFWRALDRACLASMSATLRDLGMLDGTDADTRLDALEAEGRVLPVYRRLLRHWLRTLENEGRVVSRDGYHRMSDAHDAAAERLDALLEELARTISDDPGTRDFHEYVDNTLRCVPELLDGRKRPLELLYPGDHWRGSEALYENNAAVRQHNAALAAIVSALVAEDQSAPLRVLEVGAGGGGTTQAILPALAREGTQYRYTDVSPYFFAKARDRFAGYDFIDYSLLDLNKEPDHSDHEPHSYDLIVAGNALHNSVDLNATLRHLRGLLKPGGYLLLLEGTRNTAWSLATVGFLEGAESYLDLRAESGVPILDSEQWRRTLDACGFSATQVFPDGTDCDPDLLDSLATAMPQHVIVARGPAEVARFHPAALSSHLSERLPDYMVPQHYVLLDRLPLSSNGKVALDQLPSQERRAPDRQRDVVEPDSPLEKQLAELWKQVLGASQVSIVDNFFELGGDSLQLTELQRKVSQLIGRSLPIAELFSHSSVRALAQHLRRSDESGQAPAESVVPTMTPHSSEIAVIGLAGRFPDAVNPDELWRNIAAGHCAVRSFSDDELLSAGVRADELVAGYVKAAPVLADMDRFDAAYFGIAPAEAEIMDPQQRFLLECAVEALESAGYPDESHSGRIGVFAGKGAPLYLIDHVLGRADIVARFGLNAIVREHEKDHAAPLLSYKLNLTGPSVSVNTTCSTSLVAVHMACRSLLAGECEVALAGGASFVTTLARSGYQYHEGQIFSPDGYCRAFSDLANGTIFGCGAGMVVLKPLAAALRDCDSIHAVIKGTAINNDGAHKVGYTAPSVTGQANVINAALASAGVAPDSVQYVETHGTGTSLGDSVEFSALRMTYGGARDEPAVLGTLKSNIGHLDTAAGVAGLIKVVLALRNGQVPPTLHAHRPSRRIDLADSAFELNASLREWRRGEQPRRGAVSSFGVGGTNAHTIVEEAPAKPVVAHDNEAQLLVLSAASEPAMVRQAGQLLEYLRRHPDTPLDQAAFTLQAGRGALRYRRHLVCADIGEASRMLAAAAPATRQDELSGDRVVFLFPGQGAPVFSHGADLYRSNHAFRAAFDDCARIVDQFCGVRLHDHIGVEADADTVAPTALVQPLLFSLEYAFVQYWRSLGVKPAAMLGHSLGEYVAACVAGVFSLEEALSLVIARAQLIQALPGGRMLAVFCDEATLSRYLDGSHCDLAAVNACTQCVVSGTDGAIQALSQRLQADGLETHLLKTSHAFHSRMMDDVVGIYTECVAQVELRAPSIPFVSSMTGTWITSEQATSPDYWAQHLRRPVRFASAVEKLRESEDWLFVEVGPGRSLSALARASGHSPSHCVSPHGGDRTVSERAVLLEAVGRMWSLGVAIDWTALHDHRDIGRVPLPTYPFEKTRHWIERRTEVPRSGELAPQTVDAPVAQSPDAPASHARPPLGTPFVAPASELEQQIASVWREFLGDRRNRHRRQLLRPGR